MSLDDLGLTLSWLDLRAVVTHAPADSALSRVTNPDWWVTPEIGFLRNMAYGIAWLVWAKSTDAKSGRNRPEPTPLTAAERKAAKPEREKYTRRDFEARLKWLGWTKPSPN